MSINYVLAKDCVIADLVRHTSGIWLSAQGNYGVWSWVWSYNPAETTPIVYNNWESGQPQNLRSTDCMMIMGGRFTGYRHRMYKWHDLDCANKMDYLCEKRE